MATLTTVSSNMELLTVFRKMDILFFGGIPFAKVPTGALLFAPPQKPEGFKEAYDCVYFPFHPHAAFHRPGRFISERIL